MKVTNDMIDPQLRLAGRLLGPMANKRFGTIEAVREKAENPGLLDKIIERIVPKPKGFEIDEFDDLYTWFRQALEHHTAPQQIRG